LIGSRKMTVLRMHSKQLSKNDPKHRVIANISHSIGSQTGRAQISRLILNRKLIFGCCCASAVEKEPKMAVNVAQLPKCLVFIENLTQGTQFRVYILS